MLITDPKLIHEGWHELRFQLTPAPVAPPAEAVLVGEHLPNADRLYLWLIEYITDRFQILIDATGGAPIAQAVFFKDETDRGEFVSMIVQNGISLEDYG